MARKSRSSSTITTESLEYDALKLKAKINRFKDELDVTLSLLHLRYRDATGLMGKVARSNKVPDGVVIDDILFKTWEPKVPQAVIGRRGERRITIHLTSPGFQIHDSDTESQAA